MRRSWPAALLAPLLLSACAEVPADGWRGSVDTLATGAIVIESEAPVFVPGSFWRLEEVVRIGGADGEGPELFGRIADVEIGPDGRVYVLDRQAAEVRVFDLLGRHVRTIGRKGRGPGEFDSPSALAFDASGRLWVADGRRYTVLDSAGRLVDTYTTPVRGGLAPGQLRVGADGVLLDLAALVERQDGADGSVRIRALGPGAVAWSLADSIVQRQTIAFGHAWRPPGVTRTAGGETVSVVIPLGPRRLFELTDRGLVWTGTSNVYALHGVDLDGDTVMTIRRDVEPEPLATADAASLEDWMASLRARGFDPGDVALPTTYPFFDRIIAADDGTLWLYRGRGDERAFDVFGPDGRFLGQVATGLNAGAFGTHPAIARGYVVGVSTDSLDVPRVEVHRIVRDGLLRPSTATRPSPNGSWRPPDPPSQPH